MKNLQVRIADEPYETLKNLAEERGISISDVVREALEVYALGTSYAMEGKRLFWEDSVSKERAELLIPGLTVRSSSSFLRSR